MNLSLFRNTEYLNNKFAMHISLALLNGFTFWMIGDSATDLQQNLFTVFNFIFVAPGVISQLQPLFIDRRDIYEAREKKSKMYHWAPFVTGLIVSEMPYLLVCALLYYVCWYFTCGLPTSADHAGSVFFVVVSLSPKASDYISSADVISPGNVRIPLHGHRANDSRLHAKRRLCIPRQPARHHNPRLLLRRHDSIQPDRTVLEILVGYPEIHGEKKKPLARTTYLNPC
jgi:hypothetical protein